MTRKTDYLLCLMLAALLGLMLATQARGADPKPEPIRWKVRVLEAPTNDAECLAWARKINGKLMLTPDLAKDTVYKNKIWSDNVLIVLWVNKDTGEPEFSHNVSYLYFSAYKPDGEQPEPPPVKPDPPTPPTPKPDVLTGLAKDAYDWSQRVQTANRSKEAAALVSAMRGIITRIDSGELNTAKAVSDETVKANRAAVGASRLAWEQGFFTPLDAYLTDKEKLKGRQLTPAEFKDTFAELIKGLEAVK